MPDLSIEQFDLVYNAFSFTFAAMFATFIFLVLGRGQVSPKYRGALTMSALVVAIAGYHYFRILESWEGGFSLVGETYEETTAGFNDAYRYVDWLLTVPLLVAELIAVLALSRKESNSLTLRLGVAAALMVALGYPGEVAESDGVRAIWGIAGTIPFLYILYVLFTELSSAIERQPQEAKGLVKNARLVLLVTWCFYPIVYATPILGITGATSVVAIQIGYSIADVAAKCGYGVLIYNIARAKTIAEGGTVPSGEFVTAGTD